MLHLQLPILFESLLLSTPCLPVLTATVDFLHVLLLFPKQLHFVEGGVGKLDVLMGKEDMSLSLSLSLSLSSCVTILSYHMAG